MKRALLVLLLLPSCVIYTKDGADSGLDEPDAPGDGGGSDPGPGPDTGAPDTGAADSGDTGGGDTGLPLLDADADGYLAPEDCDDANASVNPGVEEVCDDGIDNNCDGVAPGCALTGEHSVVDVADTLFQGALPGDRFGAVLSPAGDVDGDGLPDLIMSAQGNGAQAGVISLFSSPTSGFVNASAATATITGALVGDGFGSRLTALGDSNGDGYDDFAVGAPLVAAGGLLSEEQWGLHIFTGPMTGGASALTAEATVPVIAAGDELGFRIGGLPDVSGDGAVDLLIAAPAADVAPGDRAGKVWLLSGPWRRAEALDDAVAVFTGEAGDSELGRGAVGSAGDVDGDGRVDLLMSSPSVPVGGLGKVGAAYVFTRAASGQIDVAYADLRLYGISEGERFGHAASAAGDVNNDGYDDILVGAPDADLGARDAGAAYLFHGGVATGARDASDADFSVLGARADGETGAAVVGVGDLDGDGWDDLAVSEPMGVDSDRFGVVGVVYGPASGNADIEDSALLIFSDRVDDDFGLSLGAAGDTDGDGLDEMLIGIPRMSPSGVPEAGGAALVRGRGR
jgi:hypothetical protein